MVQDVEHMAAFLRFPWKLAEPMKVISTWEEPWEPVNAAFIGWSALIKLAALQFLGMECTEKQRCCVPGAMAK